MGKVEEKKKKTQKGKSEKFMDLSVNSFLQPTERGCLSKEQQQTIACIWFWQQTPLPIKHPDMSRSQS